MKYRIIEGKDRFVLAENVNELLAQGYELVGGVAYVLSRTNIHSNVEKYVQAVILKK